MVAIPADPLYFVNNLIGSERFAIWSIVTGPRKALPVHKGSNRAAPGNRPGRVEAQSAPCPHEPQPLEVTDPHPALEHQVQVVLARQPR
jgi:hypothetical protein